ncbi:CRISPR-associated helicase Cas3' [Planotetraspora sp. GP83]|uniref:CRISPR-associated helicase Cas3' n=1 Tax=Planotetraspora sp. GP83 TaxID=3156264 RepID=UPI0035176E6F
MRGDSGKSHLWVWGKTDRTGNSRKAGGPAWNPLLAHALDTAAVAVLLFDDYLADPCRLLLAETLGGGDLHQARKVVAFLVALHDIPGKACSEFQCAFHQSLERFRLKNEARQWERQARNAGLPLAPNLEHHPSIAHAKVTAQMLPAILGCSCRRRCAGNGADFPALHMIADLLGGHHGHIPGLAQLRSIDIAQSKPWHDVHQALIDDLAQTLEIDLKDLARIVTLAPRPAALPVFAGLTVLADWLASNEKFFTYRDPDDPISRWWAESQRQATQVVHALRLRRWPVQQAEWTALFGEKHTPRPAQESVMKLLPKAGPAMVIVEADTGSGKTEAAWWSAHHLTRSNGYQGMYMALPSRAATEQAGSRAKRFVSASLRGNTEQANLAIVHGTAAASAVAEELLQAATMGPATAVDGINLTCEDCQGAVLDDWFLSSKRGLLSPFGIGTVDQIVLSIQKSRFWFLRLFGLAQKVVIIDEAHAYELYQQTLLSEAITWFADAGASVIVLSATLPRAIKHSLIEAWCRGRRTTLARQSSAEDTITVVDAAGQLRGDTPSTSTDTTTRSGLLELLTPGSLSPKEGHSLERRWAQAVLEQIQQGGILAVVRNRVDSAVDLYKQARAVGEELGWDPEEIILLHGRLLERDRNHIQQRLLDLLGPHPDPKLRDHQPNPNRPPRLLVIATQVIEQSLDLDFDLMMTDLAPLDLLIQRRGRVRRHRVNDTQRPAHLEGVAPLRVLWLPTAENVPLVAYPDNIDGAVYAPYLLAATWHVLTDGHTEQLPDGLHRTVIAPDDVPTLIEAVYGDRLHGRTPPLEQLLNRTWEDMQGQLAQERQEASDRMVLAYFPGDDEGAKVEDLASDWLNGEESEPGLPRHLAARSRLGDDSHDIVCLFKQASGELTWDQAGTNVADLAHYDRDKQPTQYREQLRQLLLNTIRIPQRWFQQGKWPLPPQWKPVSNGPLHHRPTLLFEPDGQCIHGLPGELTLTKETGLQRVNWRRP